MGALQRVLITADAVGGVWPYTVDLARALNARGLECIIALLGPEPSEGQLSEIADLDATRLVITGQELDWLASQPAEVKRSAEAIASLAADECVEVIHLNSPALAACARFPAPVVAVAHGCVTTWWQATEGEPLPSRLQWHHDLCLSGLMAADWTAAPTRAFADLLRHCYGLPYTPSVIHNGREPLKPTPPPGADRVITVGRLWDRAKGAALLDAVAHQISIPFDAVGAVRGPQGEAIILRHLNHLGMLDAHDVAARLSARPVFVSAARFEPFGLAVLEAAGAGCPLVLADIAPFRELWDGAAVFISEQEPDAYAGAIEGLLAAPEERVRYGTAARTRAARYTPAATAAATHRLYEAVLATARRSAA